MNLRTMLARVVPIGGAAVCCVTVAMVALRWERAHAAIMIPTNADVGTVLHRASLDPESLAAAGVTPSEVTGVVQQAIAHLTEHATELNTADLLCSQAKQQRDQLRRTVRAGQTTADQIDTYHLAIASYESARMTREIALTSLISDATSNLPQQKRAALGQLRANAHRRPPAEFRTIERDEQAWLALCDALANERIAAKLGRDIDPDAQALLGQARSHPAVAAARANIDANGALIRSAWMNAAGF